MIHIDRLVLDGKTASALDRLEKGRKAALNSITTEALWRKMSIDTKKAIRATLGEMASGQTRCMYCEDSLGTDIEHFYPKSVYPDKMFDWSNYLLACKHCNSNEKRNEFPVDSNNRPLLIDPTLDFPEDHLELSPSTGLYLPKTNKGSASIKVFNLNRDECKNGRKNAWFKLCLFVEEYERNPEKRERLREVANQEPFADVKMWMSRYATIVLDREEPCQSYAPFDKKTVDCIRRCPDFLGLEA